MQADSAALSVRDAAAISFLTSITLDARQQAPAGPSQQHQQLPDANDDRGADSAPTNDQPAHPLTVRVRIPSHADSLSSEKVMSAKENAATAFLANISLGSTAGEGGILPGHYTDTAAAAAAAAASSPLPLNERAMTDQQHRAASHLPLYTSATAPATQTRQAVPVDSRVRQLKYGMSSLSMSSTEKRSRSAVEFPLAPTSTVSSASSPLVSSAGGRPPLRQVNVVHSGQLSHVRQGMLNLLANSRVVLATANGSPVTVMSCIRYNDEKLRQKRQRMKTSPSYLERISNFSDKKRRGAESLAHLLSPSGCLENPPTPTAYNPNYLDDPELKTGKHRTVIALPCLMGSILQYTKPADLRKELNDQFRDAHPEISLTMSLSKIRNLKRRLLDIGLREDLEISSVAKSYVFLEKLILKGLVNKNNRKLMAAICLFLACKVNQPKGYKCGPLMEAMENHLEVSSKDVREHEFAVFASLEFVLYVPPHEFLPHFERIFATLDYNNVQEYLGDNPFYIAK
ncbi:hypothetical protein RI367_001161 [Sorochytrium milnesiophthora]